MSHASSLSSPGLSTASPCPAPYLTGTPSPVQNGKPKPKAGNVFSNDGSFLERFQRAKKSDTDKSKQEENMNRKMNFENRFKNRGKRARPDGTDESENTSPSETLPTSPVSSTAGDDGIDTNPAKKPKLAEPTAAVRICMRLFRTSC
ncbi:hypothetical protein AX14_009301 [Amanita brunnescens Koide BX004]|nr:hypothetical protein AX14_009301 [Amanita brunnescens Koide BX004]